MMKKKIVKIDGRKYKLSVIERETHDVDVPRIIIPVYMPNAVAINLTRVCIESILKNTQETHEIWVIDNNSPREYTKWLCGYPQVNIVYNATEPRNPFVTKKSRIGCFVRRRGDQLLDGSYANAIALEIGTKCISSATRYVFTMHSDTLVLKRGWLSFLISKLSDTVKIAGYSQDPYRVQALHIAGLMIDFQVFRELSLTFLPNVWQERYPDMPSYDVGDWITVGIRNSGYGMYICKNTYNSPQLEETIPKDSFLRELRSVNRSFDDEGHVFYLHLGRGISKAIDIFSSQGKTSPEQWIDYADQHVLCASGTKGNQ
jgi:hypothetical protein